MNNTSAICENRRHDHAVLRSTVPVSINDSGVIVGNSCCGGGEAFERHADGTESFIHLPFAYLSNSAWAVNNNGHVVGFYADLDDVNHGWVK